MRSSSPKTNNRSAPPVRASRLSILALGLAVCAAILFLVPQNYVVLTPQWMVAVQIATVVGAVLGIYVVWRHFPNQAVALALFGGAFALAAGLAAGQSVPALVLFAPVLLGAGLATVFRNSPKILRIVLLLALVAIATSLLLDIALGPAASSSFFGEPHRLTSASDSRSRGFLGQPVPAALMAVTLTAMLAATTRRTSTQRNRLVMLIAAASLVVALAATGTRSALLVAVLTSLLWVFLRPPTAAPRKNVLVVFVVVLLVAAAILAAWPAIERFMGESRLFRFEDLSGSESAVNRLRALYVLQILGESCSDQCVLGGGPRDLQSELQLRLGFNGLSTVDNAYVTILWDFGLVGALAAIAVLVQVLRVALNRTRTMNQSSGALGLSALVISSLFFDSFYTVPVMLTFGVCLGLTFRVHDADKQRRQDGGSVSHRRNL